MNTHNHSSAGRQPDIVSLPRNPEGPVYRLSVQLLPETEEKLKNLRANHEAQTGEKLSMSVLVNSAILGRIVKREKPRETHGWSGK